MSRYFISHASPDRQFVETKITQLLEAMGIDYWYSKKNIDASAHWEREIQDGLASSDGVILIMSPAAAASEWVKNELHWAMGQAGYHIIPILHQACKPEDFHLGLARLQYADFCNNEDTGRYSLMRILKEFDTGMKSRMRAISGAWEGMVMQDKFKNDKPLHYKAALQLAVSKKGEITGLLSSFLEETTYTFKIAGGFSYERFLQFNYNSEDCETIQFGSAILELDGMGKEMTGLMIGYGAISKTIVSGKLFFRKSK